MAHSMGWHQVLLRSLGVICLVRTALPLLGPGHFLIPHVWAVRIQKIGKDPFLNNTTCSLHNALGEERYREESRGGDAGGGGYRRRQPRAARFGVRQASGLG
jgi:hypothetical protein